MHEMKQKNAKLDVKMRWDLWKSYFEHMMNFPCDEISKVGMKVERGLESGRNVM